MQSVVVVSRQLAARNMYLLLELHYQENKQNVQSWSSWSFVARSEAPSGKCAQLSHEKP